MSGYLTRLLVRSSAEAAPGRVRAQATLARGTLAAVEPPWPELAAEALADRLAAGPAAGASVGRTERAAEGGAAARFGRAPVQSLGSAQAGDHAAGIPAAPRESNAGMLRVVTGHPQSWPGQQAGEGTAAYAPAAALDGGGAPRRRYASDRDGDFRLMPGQAGAPDSRVTPPDAHSRQFAARDGVESRPSVRRVDGSLGLRSDSPVAAGGAVRAANRGAVLAGSTAAATAAATAASMPAGRDPDMAGVPTEVHVTIGRIEITAPAAQSPARRSGPRIPPPMSLDAYLARRQPERS